MEKANAIENTGAILIKGVPPMKEAAEAHGRYHVICRDKDGNIKWEDDIENAVMTEGKNAMLTHALKGSAYTATVRMGLIGNTTYTAPDAADVASAINTTGSANGWNEATSGVSASRATPTFGSASAGALALSSNQSFSITGTDTINGIFVLITSAAGVAPSSTVGNTSGALWSAGAFTGGAKAVSNGDTLSVSYTTSL
jgi:hypothetical protein